MSCRKLQQFHAVKLDAEGDAGVPDVTAGAGGTDGLHHRLLRPDYLHSGVCTVPARELFDLRYAPVAALFYDVGGAEPPGESLAVGVAGDRKSVV